MHASHALCALQLGAVYLGVPESELGAESAQSWIVGAESRASFLKAGEPDLMVVGGTVVGMLATAAVIGHAVHALLRTEKAPDTPPTADAMPLLTAQEVVDRMGDGADVSLEQLRGLCIRVVTHAHGSDVSSGRLNESDTHFVFLSGPEWLLDCMTPGSTQRDWMLSLGFEAEWLERKVKEESKTFTLLVFRPSGAHGFSDVITHM